MNCALTDWQDVFIMIGVVAVFVVPFLIWHSNQLQSEIDRLKARL